MTLYFGKRSVVRLPTGTAVHELPFGDRIVTGITAPAAGTGAKQFSAKRRMRMEGWATLSKLNSLAATAAVTVSATTWVHDGKAELSGSASMRMTTPRLALQVGAGVQVAVREAGAGGQANNNNVSLTAPSGRQAGDLLLAVGFVRNGSPGDLGTSTPNWNQATVDFPWYCILFWRIADGTSADNIVITYVNGAANNTVVGRIIAYSGVHATTPFCDNTAYYVDHYCNVFHSDIFDGSSGTNDPVPMFGDATSQTQGVHSVPYGMLVAFYAINDDSSNQGYVVHDAYAGNYPNTSAEQALLPMTLTAWHATTLGGDASLFCYHSPHTYDKAEITYYATWCDLGWSTGSTTIYGDAMTLGLRPAQSGGGTPAVWVDGASAVTWSATMELTSGATKELDGTLSATETATLDLQVLEGKKLDGILYNVVTPQCTLDVQSAVSSNLDGILRWRSVGWLAELKIGTHHQPAALLPMRASATAVLTLNYVQALLSIPVSASTTLEVGRHLGGYTALSQTGEASLARGPGTGGGFALQSWTATANLTTPLRGAAFERWLAAAVLDVEKRLAADVDLFLYAPQVGLSVVRTLEAAVEVVQTAGTTLTSDRRLQAAAGMRSTATATLSADRDLAAQAAVKWTAVLVMDRIRHAMPPVTEITVSPDLPVVESEFLPVQVDSLDSTVQVESS